MDTEQTLKALWPELRVRLSAKHLLDGAAPSLSLRIPGTDAMWFGNAADTEPRRLGMSGIPAAQRGSGLHAAAYAFRRDVCAVATGGGDFGLRLADFGGAMPGVFDEQVRHLGVMPPPHGTVDLAAALRRGANVLLLGDQPVVLGMTGSRLALNAELFEKCAKAYVLATAGGGRVRPLPWIVRHVANGRLIKDEKRARLRTGLGLLPQETKGY
ncbi:MAG TPA: hypothetical protein VIN03_09750 [Roseateles sp.]